MPLPDRYRESPNGNGQGPCHFDFSVRTIAPVAGAAPSRPGPACDTARNPPILGSPRFQRRGCWVPAMPRRGSRASRPDPGLPRTAPVRSSPRSPARMALARFGSGAAACQRAGRSNDGRNSARHWFTAIAEQAFRPLEFSMRYAAGAGSIEDVPDQRQLVASVWRSWRQSAGVPPRAGEIRSRGYAPRRRQVAVSVDRLGYPARLAQSPSGAILPLTARVGGSAARTSPSVEVQGYSRRPCRDGIPSPPRREGPPMCLNSPA